MRVTRARQSLLAQSIILLCVEMVAGGRHELEAGVLRSERESTSTFHSLDALRSSDRPVDSGHSHFNDMILNMRALDSISKKSDCFHKAATILRQSCANHDPDEDERVRASISMALCELSIARHHSIPMECAAFSALGNADMLDQSHQDTSLCVEALSRSAQHWSSFSGYMREIPQLCVAFQRWHDFDIAKSIYHNVTVEKLSLLHTLKEAEARRANQNLQWLQHLAELHQVTGEMNGVTVALESIRYKFSEDLDGITQIILNDLTDIVNRFGQVEEDLRQTVTNKVTLIESALSTHLYQDLLQVSSSLDTILAQHSSDLSMRSSAIEHRLATGLETLLASVNERDKWLNRQVSEISTVVQDVTMKLTTASGDVGLLSRNAREASAILEKQFHQAVISNQLQQRTTRGFVELSRAMEEFINQTHQELRTLNETVSILHRTPFPLHHYGWPFAWPRLSFHGLAVIAFEGMSHPSLRYIVIEVLVLSMVPLIRLFLAALRVSLFSMFRVGLALFGFIFRRSLKMAGR
ncbi:hypothetical protein SCHPADRAFT_870143 [Schizopora paradoxa]|uniref:Nuclear fusion protein KAR5 n=1 Tax=Schizopora paradoxa TaxID=27342 RepID=A0A0H2RWC1_9AGAM|nr:hypothetical protein SCHPADRAFT_870143 [Schizopora paradoxa]